MAQGNLARTYQLLGQYDLAIKYYVDSLSYMVEGSDDIAKAAHTLRLAEICWQAKDNQQATKWFKTVKESDLNRNHKIVYKQLATALTL
ncbi:tetratricopeptide repeat protein [Pseudoalteromonas sp. B160]|uniref:tetratricopeptide repeat protein n=1 Tax=Pseudoalteromonas sp. B160 TaxID=630414 RepID=UPI00301C850B